jgi:hypothetical protein
MKNMKIVFTTMIALVLLGAPAMGQQFRNAPLVYIAVAETMTGDPDPESKARLEDFDKAIAAALIKKKTPVTLVTDENKAQWVIQGSSTHDEGGRAAAVKTLIFGSRGSTKIDVTLTVLDHQNSTIAYAYNVVIKKDDFKSAAEDFAGRFKKDLKNR